MYSKERIGHVEIEKEEAEKKLEEWSHEAEIETNENSTIKSPFDPKKIDIETDHLHISELVDKIEHDELNLNPDFQREAEAWEDGRQSRLIESLLLKIPIPMFYFATDEEGRWLVVDGLQRLTAILRFVYKDYEKEFNKEKLFLKELEYLSNLETVEFSKLPREYQTRINRTRLTFHLIKPGTPVEVMYNIFQRINTGGVPLNAQEIRHALNIGKATKLLNEIVKYPEFKEATCGMKDNRMQGRESLLRFIAFYKSGYENYDKSGNLNLFLINTMQKINKEMSPEDIEEIKDAIRKSMSRCQALFGIYAFRKYYSSKKPKSPINRALFETWAYHIIKLDDKSFATLKERKEKLLFKFASMNKNNSEFFTSISFSTSNKNNVDIRFRAIENLIKEVLND